ncbi:MAG: sensor histidine kinase [Cellvibrionaceae bacterium]
MSSWRMKIALALIWFLATACFTIWLTYDRIANFERKLESDGQYLHRLISQRVDQHDAHLTGISTLASSSHEPPLDLLVNLTATISRFYPRIEAVELVTLQTEIPEVVLSTPLNKITGQAKRIRDAALISTGKLQILPTVNGYLLVKRSPNSNQARYGIALGINSKKLVESDLELDAFTLITLKTEGHDEILSVKAGQTSETNNSFTRSLVFQKTLSSRSQPLILILKRRAILKEIIPLRASILFAVLMAVILVISRVFISQWTKTKKAERRAILGEHEARIAQASRINGLGEMASSIAHELNQPLTAILSQSQAGRRLIEEDPNRNENVTAVLKTIAQQAKRAGDILSRLRDWSSQEMNPTQAVNLNDVAKGIANLIFSDLKTKSISLKLRLDTPAPEALCDPVQIEQVLFNLVRNSIEAMENLEGNELSISTRCLDGEGVIEVLDTGKGIAPDLLPRLLEPFFSTKPDGMGLGLSLCDSIIARFSGKLEIINHPQGGVCSTVTLPLVANKKEEV